LIAASEISVEDGMLKEEFPDAATSGVELQNGYMQSTFVAEKLLAQGETLGIPITTIRFPVILGNSVTGVMPVEYDHAWTFLTTCMQLKKFPNMSQGISMVPVDVAAKITVLLFLNDEAERGMYNLTTETTATEGVITEVAKEFKINPVFIPFTEWRAQVSTQDPDNGALRLFMEAYKDQTDEPAEVTAHPLIPTAQLINLDTFSKKTIKNIKKIGEIMPTASDILRRHLRTHFSGLCRQSDAEESDVEIEELTPHMLG
jgi:thioester reductase-like protein